MKVKRTLTPFGKEVKKALIDKDMTVNDLAKEAGVCADYIANILRGRRAGTNLLITIANILDIDPPAGAEWKTRYELTTFGAEVKKALIDKRMTQTDLANLLGISRQWLNQILHMEQKGMCNYEKIAEFLDIDPPTKTKKPNKGKAA